MGELITLVKKNEEVKEGRITPLALIEEIREILETQTDVVLVFRDADDNVALANNSMKLEDMYYLLGVAKQTILE